MGKKYIGWLLIFFGIFSFWGVRIVSGTPLDTIPNITTSADDFETQYELTQDLYKTSGLAAYFEERSLLWTETTKRRNDLFSKLPTIPKGELEQFQIQVFHLLELNPHDPLVLILAGNYHDYCRQKQTALWYYQQAFELAPQSEAVKLALADYYLYEWQPEKVKQILSGQKSPAIFLRKGAASIQSGEFTLALGYFLQSTPLSTPWQVARDKDLFKAYLALGEIPNASLLINQTYLHAPLSGVLFRELMGWSAWLTGNPRSALSNWQAGKNAYSNYKLWESNMDWLSPDIHISLANATKEFHDSDLDAAFEISQGNILLQQGQWELAYKEYLAAIHHDHRSLIGFLGAVSVQLLKKNYKDALDLCNQGLAVNSGFGPLLMKRAEILEKMGRPSEAAKDKAQAAMISNTKTEGTALHFQWGQTASKSQVILVQGKIKDLVGVWLSENGTSWKWYPWWGGTIDVDHPLRKAWVIPCGPGLSGQASYLEWSVPPILSSTLPIVQDNQVRIEFPFPVQLVVELLNSNHQIYIGEQMATTHQIPLSFFQDTQNQIQIRWQNETGLWGNIKCNLDLSNFSKSVISTVKPGGPIQFSISTDTQITRYRRIAVHLKLTGGGTDDIEKAVVTETPGGADYSDDVSFADDGNLTDAVSKAGAIFVSLGEAGSMMEWVPFQPVINYELSLGDGPKTIICRLKDSEGHVQETHLDIDLDTTAPNLQIQGGGDMNSTQFKWSANEAITCWLRIFTDQGKWQIIPVLADSDGVFTGKVTPQDGIYCQIVARDNAGNITITQDDRVNSQLRQAAPAIFDVNILPDDQTHPTLNRWILIKPQTPDLKWEVSNDQSTWSNWQGDNPLTWRTNPGEVQRQRLIFVRYKIGDSALFHYLVIPVMNDPGAAK